jgi:hypothetical protein
MNIQSFNDKGVRHGHWEYYWGLNDPMYKAFYVNGIITGYLELYKNDILELKFRL